MFFVPPFHTHHHMTCMTYVPSQALSKIIARHGETHREAQEIYWHVTCATDTCNVSTVFNACKEIILKDNLQGSGFMD